MELIIVIFFFALTSAVCLQVFVKAHDTAFETESLNYATLWADNACELFYEYGDDENAITSLMRESFDLDYYYFSLDFCEDESFEYMTFGFYYDPTDALVYEYTFKKHIQEVAE